MTPAACRWSNQPPAVNPVNPVNFSSSGFASRPLPCSESRHKHASRRKPLRARYTRSKSTEIRSQPQASSSASRLSAMGDRLFRSAPPLTQNSNCKSPIPPFLCSFMFFRGPHSALDESPLSINNLACSKAFPNRGLCPNALKTVVDKQGALTLFPNEPDPSHSDHGASFLLHDSARTCLGQIPCYRPWPATRSVRLRRERQRNYSGGQIRVGS
jgi:hypothetical protein